MMKHQELTAADLLEVNGGNNLSSSSGVGLLIGADSLLSLGYEWSDGSGRSYASKLEIGKDIRIGGISTGNSSQY